MEKPLHEITITFPPKLVELVAGEKLDISDSTFNNKQDALKYIVNFISIVNKLPNTQFTALRDFLELKLIELEK